jgi:GNAT superfamily N-acetyltransferase
VSSRPRRGRPRAELWADGPLLPPGWRPDPAGHLRLGDGTLVSLRPFRPGDGALLVAGFARMSPQSRYRRFLTPMPRLSDSMLAFLTSVDDADHHAWGAMVDEPDGEFGAGVVRWVRSKSDPAAADMAVTVIDDYQGRGLGGLLLDVAVLDAFTFGVERFEGTVLSENTASRRMLTRGGATFRTEGGGVLAFTLPLHARAEFLHAGPLPGLVGYNRRRFDLIVGPARPRPRSRRSYPARPCPDLPPARRDRSPSWAAASSCP